MGIDTKIKAHMFPEFLREQRLYRSNLQKLCQVKRYLPGKSSLLLSWP